MTILAARSGLENLRVLTDELRAHASKSGEME